MRNYILTEIKTEKISLFHKLDAKDLEFLADKKYLFIKTFSKNSYIFSEGDKSDSIYILLKGKVAVVKEFASGQKHVITVIQGYGEIFAEIFPFLEDKEIEFSAMAYEESQVAILKKSCFSEEGKVSSVITGNMLGILSEKAYFLNKKLQILSGLTLRQKLCRLLIMNENAGLMSRELMADYLGSTRPSVSRELSKMQSEGLILIKGKEIHIENIEALECNL